MTPKQKKRMIIVLAILSGVIVTVTLGLIAIKDNIRYFVSPSDLSNQSIQLTQQYRVAGIVKPNSVKRLSDNITSEFILTDCEADIKVVYTGILPDLFREGQTIVADGKFDSQKVMTAKKVLAKHDENYVPTEAGESLMEAQANQCANQLNS